MDMKVRALALAVLLGLCGTVAEAQKVRWSVYKSNLLGLMVSVLQIGSRPSP